MNRLAAQGPDQEMLSQVERILNSETFRNADALRNLLRFLAAKACTGEADQLKEYSVGLDALGKPVDYDPRHDATVRIRAGRLRQKLDEFYRTEGKNDPFIIELPKGHFKLGCTTRPVSEPLIERSPVVIPKWRDPVFLVLSGALLVALVWAAFLTVALRARETSEATRSLWTPELEQLWQPFLARRPLIVSIEDPPFVLFKDIGVYKTLGRFRWGDVVKSPSIIAIRKALNNPEIQPTVYYVPIGEVSASFLLGKLLGPRLQTMSLVRNSELSWQQLADNNVLFIGAQVFFLDQLRGLPMQLDLLFENGGVHNLHPQPGEPTLFAEEPATQSVEEGQAYALITHIPGPGGTSEVLSFTSNQTSGRLAAVQWFTDGANARTLVDNLKKPSGRIPRYYQVLLKFRFKDGVPVETSYVLHHALTQTGEVAGPNAMPNSVR